MFISQTKTAIHKYWDT